MRPQDILKSLRQVLGPLSLDNFRPEDLALLAKEGILKTAYRDRIYDRQRYVAGTAVPSAQQTFFSVVVGQQASVGNAAATVYPKTLIDTNVSTPNQLSRGQIFIVKSIQMMLVLTGNTDTTVTGGDTTGPEAAAATAGFSNLRALTLSGDIQFILGERGYEAGPLYFFPSDYGISGAAGGGAATNYESVANNGFGRAVLCHPFHVIDAGRRFAINLNWRNLVVPTRSFSLVAILDGVRLTSIQ